MDLTRRPAGAGHSLISEIMDTLLAGECRRRARATKGTTKLAEAAGAVLGGVLVAALAKGTPVFRPMSPNTFSSPVGYRTARFVLDTAVAQGWLTHHPGIHFQREIAGFGEVRSGRASRYHATELLLEIAARHGVTAFSVSKQFPR